MEFYKKGEWHTNRIIGLGLVLISDVLVGLRYFDAIPLPSWTPVAGIVSVGLGGWLYFFKPKST